MQSELKPKKKKYLKSIASLSEAYILFMAQSSLSILCIADRRLLGKWVMRSVFVREEMT